MDQWFLRITKYAEELLSGIDTLTQWPDHIRTMQRNWIGKSVGAEIDFALEIDPKTKIRVFTTRPDTIYGVSAILIAPNHQLASKLNEKPEIPAEVFDTETTDKVGFFTGGYAVHPLTARGNSDLASEFCSYGLGTGALMAVPPMTNEILSLPLNISCQ